MFGKKIGDLFLRNEAFGNQLLERNAQSKEKWFQKGFLAWRSLSLVCVLLLW